MLIPESVQRLIDALSRLPGVGPKTASRLTFHLLRGDETLAVELAEALAGADAVVAADVSALCSAASARTSALSRAVSAHPEARAAPPDAMAVRERSTSRPRLTGQAAAG